LAVSTLLIVPLTFAGGQLTNIGWFFYTNLSKIGFYKKGSGAAVFGKTEDDFNVVRKLLYSFLCHHENSHL